MAPLRNCTVALCLLFVFVPRNVAQDNWIGTWATAPQAAPKGPGQTFHNQTIRLIVYTSVGGKRVRIKISNTFGDQSLLIGAAHIARRASGADIDPASDRTLKFHGRSSVTIPPRSIAVSDAADLDIPALSDLAISLFFPETAPLTTSHILAKQTNYVSAETGDATAQAKFPVAKTITFWPFLTGVDVQVSPHAAAIVALGSSLTDGDGSTRDTNRRWPDVLAELLQKAGGEAAELGVLNEGIIGNRLLSDTQSPRQAGGPPPLAAVLEQLGPALGESGLVRFDRDVLSQAGVKYVILALGVNDMLFPGSFIPQTEGVTAQDVINGNRQLIARAHKKGIRAIGTTIPPFEHSLFRNPFYDHFYSPENEKIRQEVNAWIRNGGEFDGVIDFDEAVRDPDHPTQILAAYDSGDHLHVNNAGNVAQGNAISLSLFRTSRAANDPFVGKWKVNPSKSKLYDEMKVEAAGANRYAITFGPGQVDTVVADGSDQPGLGGTTFSITVKGPNSWEVVRKMKGRTLLIAHWTLSEDGKTLNDAFTQYLPDGMTLFSQPLPDGSTLFLPYVYERTAGNSGFLGTWDSESAKVAKGIELQIQPYEGDGLSFKRSDEEMVKRIKLDGNDYPDLDPKGGDEGTAYSARRVNERSLEITEKFKGKITGTRQIELSSDLKTLMVTVSPVGQSKPQSIFVYDRE